MPRDIFVIGAPRTGTTFTAKKIAEYLNEPLLPEAQWVLEILIDKPATQYTKSFWNIPTNSVIQNRDDLLGFQNMANINQEYECVRLFDHTPQNCFILDKLKSLCHQPIFIAPLRDPLSAIGSLTNQDWFGKSFCNASFYNFKCMLALYRQRKNIKFLKINDSNFELKLRTILADEKMALDFKKKSVNAIENTEKLLDSHRYLKQGHQEKVVEKSIIKTLICLPSYLIYALLCPKSL